MLDPPDSLHCVLVVLADAPADALLAPASLAVVLADAQHVALLWHPQYAAMLTRA
jgi:hypothetical protein